MLALMCKYKYQPPLCLDLTEEAIQAIILTHTRYLYLFFLTSGDTSAASTIKSNILLVLLMSLPSPSHFNTNLQQAYSYSISTDKEC